MATTIVDIYSTFEQSMVNVVNQVCTELQITLQPIVSHQNGPEPRQNYVVINTLNIDATGHADSQRNAMFFQANSMKQYMVQQYEVVVQLQFFGQGAGGVAMGYYSQLSGNSVIREIHTKNNLAIRRRTNLRRAPQLRDGVWVNSFAFDMTLGFAVRSAQEIDWVDSITVNGENIPLI